VVNTNFFHVAENQTRLTDQNQVKLGLVTDSLWRGIYHVFFAMYSRYYRPVIGVQVHSASIKGTQNYPIVATATVDWIIDGIGTEDVGIAWEPTYGVYGSSGCPNPYDSVNSQLASSVLVYGIQNMNVRSVIGSGSPILEAVAEPPQVSAAQELADSG